VLLFPAIGLSLLKSGEERPPEGPVREEPERLMAM